MMNYRIKDVFYWKGEKINMDEKQHKLEWCPFCGSIATIKDNKYGSYWVRCTNPLCMCELGCEDTIEEAIKRWNYREY